MNYESVTIEVLQEKLAKKEFGNLVICESSFDSNKHKEKSRDTEHQNAKTSFIFDERAPELVTTF